jgi:glucan phosphoethanolaminetransferase (alkaline phosphatase superfamily)
MTRKKIKTIIIVSVLLLLIASLTQDAIIINHSQKIESQSSAGYFFFGFIVLLGGALFEWIIWLANPLCLLTIISLVKDKRSSVITSSIALLLAASFRLWKEVLGSESGSMAPIISFEPGYYLWLASILLLNIGVIYYFFIFKDKTVSDKVF